jgi:uncharacterized protein YqjF (DUF2071 family)
MAMRWHDLLFMHWPVRPAVLRPLIPAALTLDTFEGWAWLGVVPFRMTGVRPRCLPACSCLSAFPEINVRTYVTTPGRSGVWFFSLDAASRLAVRAARFWYGLPYYDARMRVAQEGEAVHYHSTRTHRRAAVATFEASYTPSGAVSHTGPGTLEHWLTARYCLYAVDRHGRVGYGDIHHAPWPLQDASAELRSNTMAVPLHVELPRTQPVLHFARYLEVVAWSVLPLVE